MFIKAGQMVTVDGQLCVANADCTFTPRTTRLSLLERAKLALQTLRGLKASANHPFSGMPVPVIPDVLIERLEDEVGHNTTNIADTN